jgi:hypothetical protein
MIAKIATGLGVLAVILGVAFRFWSVEAMAGETKLKLRGVQQNQSILVDLHVAQRSQKYAEELANWKQAKKMIALCAAPGSTLPRDYCDTLVDPGPEPVAPEPILIEVAEDE